MARVDSVFCMVVHSEEVECAILSAWANISNQTRTEKSAVGWPIWGQILITGRRRDSDEFGRSDSDPNWAARLPIL